MSSSITITEAAASGDHQLVKRLISLGHDINQKGRDGMTALAISSFWGYTEIVSTLLQNGADVNAVNKGTNWTPLHCASFQGHGPVVLNLLRAGADPTAKDSDQRAPVDFASAIEAIWPLFAAAGFTRTSKAELIQKRIIIKETTGRSTGASASRGGYYGKNSYLSRPGSSYVLATEDLHKSTTTKNANYYAAALGGDVLANQRM